MTDDRIPAIEALLREASDAHHVFERDELHGAYDEEWPRWYGHWAVAHGLGGILGRTLTGDAVGEFFGRTWAEAEASSPKPEEPWATWMARRIVSEL